MSSVLGGIQTPPSPSSDDVIYEQPLTQVMQLMQVMKVIQVVLLMQVMHVSQVMRVMQVMSVMRTFELTFELFLWIVPENDSIKN